MTREVTTVSFVHLEHEEKSMSVTADVLKKLGPNRRLVAEKQLPNMFAMSLTELVSKFDKSKDLICSQPKNMKRILVTALVSKLKIRDLSFLQS